MKTQPGMSMSRRGPGPAMLIRCQCGEDLLTLQPGRRVTLRGAPADRVHHVTCHACKAVSTVRTAADE